MVANRTHRTAVALMGAALLYPAALTAEKLDQRVLPEHVVYRENSACNPIEPPHIEKMPHTQGETALCFAFAAADMISQRIGVAVSPLDLATTFYFASSRDTPAVASLSEQIRFERQGIEVGSDRNPARHPFVDKLQGGEENYAALLADSKGLCREGDLPSEAGFHDDAGLLFYFRLRALAARDTKICRKELFGLPANMRDSEADDLNLRWVNYVNGRCKRFSSPVPLRPVTYSLAPNLETLLRKKAEGWAPSPAQKAQVFGMIDYALEHHRFPAVGYSYDVLEMHEPNQTTRELDHSSVIVGRKKIGGACHYMVQDDIGENCIDFYPKLRDRCILGRIWLTKAELLDTLFSVVYLR